MGRSAATTFAVSPLDLIERLALVNDWPIERLSEDELTMTLAGDCGPLSLSLVWRADLESLHLACLYSHRVPALRRAEMGRLINLVNEQLLYGHFDMWRQDGSVMFRNNLILAGGMMASDAQLETLIATALEAAERYYGAFQFAIWAGEPAERAFETSLFAAAGNA